MDDETAIKREPEVDVTAGTTGSDETDGDSSGMSDDGGEEELDSDFAEEDIDVVIKLEPGEDLDSEDEEQPEGRDDKQDEEMEVKPDTVQTTQDVAVDGMVIKKEPQNAEEAQDDADEPMEVESGTNHDESLPPDGPSREGNTEQEPETTENAQDNSTSSTALKPSATRDANGLFIGTEIYQCEHCQQMYSSQRYLDKHVKAHPKTDKPSCELCGSVILTTREAHKCSTPTAFKCACGQEFPTKAQFTRHKNKKLRPSKCSVCGLQFSTIFHLNSHIALKHSGVRAYKCQFCEKLFASMEVRRSHEHQHLNEPNVQCEFCDKSFYKESELKIHVEKGHSGEKPYFCTICSETFATKDGRNSHENSSHSEENLFKCEYCTARFGHKEILQAHEQDHVKRKRFVCPQCDKVLTSLSGFKEHVSKHTGTKDLKCEICDYQCFKQYMMKKHMESHLSPKPHKCADCGKGFCSAGSLKRHQRTHSGEKPYQCSFCPEAFSRSTSRKVHESIHTGDKPYPCRYCDQRFTKSYHRTVHEDKHKLNDKPPREVSEGSCQRDGALPQSGSGSTSVGDQSKEQDQSGSELTTEQAAMSPVQQHPPVPVQDGVEQGLSLTHGQAVRNVGGYNSDVGLLPDQRTADDEAKMAHSSLPNQDQINSTSGQPQSLTYAAPDIQQQQSMQNTPNAVQNQSQMNDQMVGNPNIGQIQPHFGLTGGHIQSHSQHHISSTGQHQHLQRQQNIPGTDQAHFLMQNQGHPMQGFGTNSQSLHYSQMQTGFDNGLLHSLLQRPPQVGFDPIWCQPSGNQQIYPSMIQLQREDYTANSNIQRPAESAPTGKVQGYPSLQPGPTSAPSTTGGAIGPAEVVIKQEPPDESSSEPTRPAEGYVREQQPYMAAPPPMQHHGNRGTPVDQSLHGLQQFVHTTTGGYPATGYSYHPGVTQHHPGVSQHHPGVTQHHPSVTQHHPGVTPHHPAVTQHPYPTASTAGPMFYLPPQYGGGIHTSYAQNVGHHGYYPPQVQPPTPDRSGPP